MVLLTLMSDQPIVHEGGRLGGRQSGRKCGDVDDYLSDHGNSSRMYIRHRHNKSRFGFLPFLRKAGNHTSNFEHRKLNILQSRVRNLRYRVDSFKLYKKSQKQHL